MDEEILKCTLDNKKYPKIVLEELFADTCVDIFKNYKNYDYREKLVLKALIIAKDLNIKSGFRHDRNEIDWPIVVILLLHASN